MDSENRLGIPDEGTIAAARSRARESGAPDYLDQIGDVMGLVVKRSLRTAPQ